MIVVHGFTIESKKTLSARQVCILTQNLPNASCTANVVRIKPSSLDIVHGDGFRVLTNRLVESSKLLSINSLKFEKL